MHRKFDAIHWEYGPRRCAVGIAAVGAPPRIVGVVNHGVRLFSQHCSSQARQLDHGRQESTIRLYPLIRQKGKVEKSGFLIVAYRRSRSHLDDFKWRRLRCLI
jgi:hypothetical protein